ncbi:MAG TPA: NUDIX hydrolase [Streptosporangiaceae bacterium]|nr:NUDIX hydrolase [Streptosporangiaceae bacterium]
MAELTGASAPAASGPVDADTWFASLPGVVVAAGALITDPGGRVLLVKPNYRELWSIPGGICEFGEPPHVGCHREVAEEIGLEIPVGRLLAIDWSQPYGEQARPIMHLVFDGGQVDDGGDIVLQEAELDGYRFTAPDELAAHLPPFGLARITGALRAVASGVTVYVPRAVST